MRQHGFPDARGLHGLTPAAPIRSRCRLLCRFSAAGMTVYPRAPRAGGRKAPRHEIAGWERRWRRNYGDFAAGSDFEVGEGGGNVGNVATRHGTELSCERVTDRLCNAILRF